LKYREGRAEQRGEAFGEAGPREPMTIFVPPAVSRKVEAVFHLPVPSHETQ
jgi:hypothetical protein